MIKDIYKQDFGSYLTYLRTRRNLKQDDLAMALGYSKAYIGDVERGERHAFKKGKLEMLPIILGLNDEETHTLYDLAGETRKRCAHDISEYVEQNEDLRKMIRFAMNAGVENDTWRTMKKLLVTKVSQEKSLFTEMMEDDHYSDDDF